MRFHTSLPVRNIHDTVMFYRALFDLEPVKAKCDYAKFLPTDAGLNISFHESADVGELTPLHLGLEMPDRAALDRAHSRLTAAGSITVERETSICCYANQDKFWVADPDGYRWEVYLLLEDTVVKIDSAASCCVSPANESRAAACCGSGSGDA